MGILVFGRPRQLVARRQDARKVLAQRLAHRYGNRWVHHFDRDHEHGRSIPRLVLARSVCAVFMLVTVALILINSSDRSRKLRWICHYVFLDGQLVPATSCFASRRYCLAQRRVAIGKHRWKLRLGQPIRAQLPVVLHHRPMLLRRRRRLQPLVLADLEKDEPAVRGGREAVGRGWGGSSGRCQHGTQGIQVLVLSKT